jgi:three-Cys-motif partner protein
MRTKFRIRHYIDLFSGPGRCVVDDGSGEIDGSPLIALGVSHHFTGHHFVDKNPAAVAALRARTTTAGFREPNVRFYEGDANQAVRAVLKNLPPSALSVAVIDPTGLQLRFDTLAALTTGRRLDLIYMFPEAMAGRRNLERFLKKPNDPLSLALGTELWKPKVRPSLRIPDSGDAIREWREADQVIVQTLVAQLKALGYAHIKLGSELVGVRNRRNVEMYYIVFASKHALGHTFWKAIGRHTPSGQARLFDE